MFSSFARRATCALLILCCVLLTHAEPIHRRPYREPRDSYDDRTVAAAFQALSFKFWNSVSERSIDIKHDLGAPPQRDPRYQLIKRQGGTSVVTNSTPSVTPTPEPSTSQVTSTQPPPTSSTAVPTDTSKPSSAPPSSQSPSSPSQSPAPSTSQSPRTSAAPTSTQASSAAPTSAFSSTIIGTTTNAQGGLVTYTSVVLVQPTRTQSGGSGGATGSTSGKPSLQSGGAPTPVGMKKEMLAIFGGAVAVAMAL
ncbi:hypothetical protein PRK78_002816 [Emydomyces testavorans]|uniref:Uncharacterized protein n=1 Tax=Emydomyces testavorans TaxID=2070801 RepID=A0AAF0DGI0_9EURO|nr:hypothetical protein PRK78_002816 [Emydomyces testavorans]